MNEFEEKLGKGYGQNKIILQVRDPETIHAYWEIGKEQQDEIKKVGEDKESELILRLHDIKNSRIHHIKLDKNNFLGKYYFKAEHGVMPDCKYFVDIGILKNLFYIGLVPKSNVVKMPSGRPCDRKNKREKRTLELIEKIEEQIRKDKESSETRYGYYLK